jgi:tetratricopeptide (TPR) repeat protein
VAKTKPAKIVKPPFWLDDKKVAWLFFGIAFLLYAKTIWYDFTLDDIAVIKENDFVHDGFKGFGKILNTFYWAGYPVFANLNSGLFRPLSLMLFAVEWQFFGKNPHAFHFVNVMLYAICSLLLYRTLRDLFRDYSLTLPFLATLLWIVFPAHTEVVANVKSGDELLSMIFFLLCLRQLMKWESPSDYKSLLLAGLFFFLSLLSKEGAILFLPVIFILFVQFRQKSVKEIIRPAIILATVSIIWFSWHSYVISHASSPKITYTYHDNSLVAAPDLVSRASTAMLMQGKYLLKSVTGFPLSYDYSYNENPYTGLSDPLVLISILVCVGLFVLSILKFKKDPVLSFGILFYFITFALTSNVFVLIGATMADRFLFVPSIGFVIALTWIILKLTKGESQKLFASKALYILLPLSLLYSIRSFARSSDWIDEKTLYTVDVENADGSARVHSNCGIELRNQANDQPSIVLKNQEYDLAFKEFQNAIKIDSLDYGSYSAAGECLFLSGRFDESVYWRTRALQIEPRYVVIYRDLGNSLLKCAKYDSAIIVYQQAVNAKSSDSLTRIHIGDCYLLKRDTAKAIEFYQQNTVAYPNYIDGWNKLGNFYGATGQMEKSTAAFFQITKIDPNNYMAYKMLYTNYRSLYKTKRNVEDSLTAEKYAQSYYKAGGK